MFLPLLLQVYSHKFHTKLSKNKWIFTDTEDNIFQDILFESFFLLSLFLLESLSNLDRCSKRKKRVSGNGALLALLDGRMLCLKRPSTFSPRMYAKFLDKERDRNDDDDDGKSDVCLIER